jgi:pimeloyl-ACP methyl ester carboxylesterase
MVSEPDRVVGVNGVKIAVDDRGRGGIPLVLVHGFTGSRIDFADVIDDLATDRRVVAWDHRGHADSTNTGDLATYTFDQLVADMEALVDELDLERFDLLGHSMGGIVAMRYVLAHPDRVRSLILMDTLATPDVIPPEFMRLMIDTARHDGMDAVADQAVQFEASQNRVPTGNRAVVLERVRHKMTNVDLEAYAGLGECLITFDPLIDRLRSDVHCPTTIIVGEDDVGLRAASTAMAEAIAGAVESVIPHSVHSPQEENPQAWLAAVRGHLARIEP